MSTDLYGIRVLKKSPEEKKLQIKVFVVYYDVAYKDHQPIPKDHSFFFRILRDCGPIKYNATNPIENEIPNDLFFDEKWIDKNTFKFIEKVELLSTANFPVEDYSAYHDFYYERNGAWVEEENLVQATYDVYVSDEKYISHLEEGMSWGTTSYETTAAKISKKHRKYLPDLSQQLTQLRPFQGKKQEKGTICTARFSNDGTILFVLSDAGELVAYRTQNWEELWRQETKKWFGTIACNEAKQLVWITTERVFNFEGQEVEEQVLPKFEAAHDKAEVFASPSCDYFVLSHYTEKLVIYDNKGKYLWDYKSEAGDSIHPTFFHHTDQLLIREESSGLLKFFDLKTGLEIKKIDLSRNIARVSIHPTGAYLSTNDFQAKSSTIFDLEDLQPVFEFSTKRHNGDYLGACIWSPNQKFGLIITIGEGQRQNNGYGGYLSVYSLASKG